ncbi:MAG: hypothetical protein JXC32_17950 [Anaerolineae bacterium]|nr:hypothetical protein [Anaerolineae bacterium]
MTEIEITGYKCKSCGRIHYPKHEQCLDCKHREFEPVAPEGNAKLLAYTQIFNLPWGFDERFLIIGVGEFENGLKAMGQIKADSLKKLKPGMKLKASWAPVRMEAGGPVYGVVYEPLR